ncbi:MAG: hypothetical protein KAW81_02115, partial [Dehalococcoidia bacterium]|nr:hypothetical protein [Dehalococcoidia bacterium]
KQVGTYQASEGFEEEEEAKPKQKKADPWLIGCIALVAIVVFIGVAYFVYSEVLQEAPPTIPYPVSDNQTGLRPMETHECELLQLASSFVVPEE